jgi:hypothetical protein
MDSVIMLDALTSADFTPYLHETFRIRLSEEIVIDLELIAVTDLNSATARDPEGRRPFSIEFLGPISQQYLIQHVYRLEHTAFGVLEIFLVPLGPLEGRMRYEAIFN